MTGSSLGADRKRSLAQSLRDTAERARKMHRLYPFTRTQSSAARASRDRSKPRELVEPFTGRREGLCDGSLDCKAKVHVHGCWLDHGDCDEPCEHDERVLEIRHG